MTMFHLHRILLAVLVVAYIGFFFLVPRSFLESGFAMLAMTLIFACYFGLVWADTRLAEEYEIDFEPIPLWVLYIFTGLGPFISIWLDLRVRREIEGINQWGRPID
ncbi:hypothetical protein AAG614_02340 [Citromicrobium bathyomarinum]